MNHFKRITVDANQMGGIPCIRGLRIPVATVVGMVGEGMTKAEVLKAYPDLKLEDIREALRYTTENSMANLTETQMDGIRRRVRSGIANIEFGKFTEYERAKGLKKLSAKVIKAGRLSKKSRRDEIS